MSAQRTPRQTAINRINELWGTHDHGDRNANINSRCFAFVVDPRYVSADGGEELRLAVSYGDNPFTEAMKVGFVPPPVLPGTHVFGIHVVGTLAGRITMFDHWFDAREATGRESLAEADQRAREILAGIPDDEYARMAGDSSSGREVFRSAERPIEAFEVMPGETL